VDAITGSVRSLTASNCIAPPESIKRFLSLRVLALAPRGKVRELSRCDGKSTLIIERQGSNREFEKAEWPYNLTEAGSGPMKAVIRLTLEKRCQNLLCV
jgi:hypothetical protein